MFHDHVWQGHQWSATGLLRRARLAVAVLPLVVGSVVTANSTVFAADPAAPLRVVATIKPVHALVAGVMAGVASPTVLLSGNASPHTFALKPSEARALANADVLFRVSPALEPFTVRLANSLPARVEVVSLGEAAGLALLPRRVGDGFERHDHGPGGGDGHGHKHAHGGPAPKGDAVDPHVWLDPDNARAMTRAIVATLSARAPAHAARFAENGRRLDESLATLGREIGTQLAPLAGTPLIVFHDAYQYLEHRYGLKVVGSITLNPEVAPSAKRLTDLRARIARDGVACILSEPQFSPRIVEAVLEGSRARAGVLDPVGGTLPAGPDHYHQTLRALAAAIVACRASG